MKKTIEKHLTLREKILETIRDAIATGVLKPGEKVAEPEPNGSASAGHLFARLSGSLSQKGI
jgi:hypothetical protein